ncbi:DUF6602 domain-containing protein [Blastococcus sp. HT6-30]|uniref:DUF6602 domain-containing protein n=1 Tax=Blastococcus sp. HT6-30 TaxID=3144843 RepID=UPI00321AA1B1
MVSIARQVLESLAAETTARLSTADLISHPGERGRAREHILTQFLRQIVPKAFDIETGFVIDTRGGQSLQQDLIIVRRDYHPVFTVGGINFFPVEGVAAVVEVKSGLSTTTLVEALRNAASVKLLDRTASGSNYLVIGGPGGFPAHALNPQFVVDPDNHQHQIFSLIVAARLDVKMETLVDRLADHISNEPRTTWPNFISIAGAFSVGYNSDVRSDQMGAVGLRVFDPSMAPDNSDPLVDLAIELWSFLRVTPLVDVRPFQYVMGSQTGVNVDF